MIETIRYQFTPETGAAIDAFEGLNEEADACFNQLLSEGYREVFREIIPPESGRHNHLVIVKLWKADTVPEIKINIEPGVNFDAFASGLLQAAGVAGDPPDNKPAGLPASYSWSRGNEATPSSVAAPKRAPRKVTAKAKRPTRK